MKNIIKNLTKETLSKWYNLLGQSGCNTKGLVRQEIKELINTIPNRRTKEEIIKEIELTTNSKCEISNEHNDLQYYTFVKIHTLYESINYDDYIFKVVVVCGKSELEESFLYQPKLPTIKLITELMEILENETSI